MLIGWQFALAEFVGGLVMIALMAISLRAFVSPRLEAQAREHAQTAATGHEHHAAGSDLPWSRRLRSAEAWSDVAHNFRGDWQMLWKEVGIGFLLAGFIGLLPMDVFNVLFVTDAPPALRTIENVLVGPLIAVLSFVCSIGNVPLAAVLWSGGISFSGVLAFLFADLIVLPIVAIYRKYYGTAFALRITALMLVAMVFAALGRRGRVRGDRPRPRRRGRRADDVFGSVGVDYKLVLNVIALAVFAALFALTARRGATDPVCGMTVDRAKAATLEVDGPHGVLLLRALPPRVRGGPRRGRGALLVDPSARTAQDGSTNARRARPPSAPPRPRAARRDGGAAPPSRRSARRS